MAGKKQAIGEKNRVYRFIHRKMHIDQIEELLKNRGSNRILKIHIISVSLDYGMQTRS
jgi:hypothetical protein